MDDFEMPDEEEEQQDSKKEDEKPALIEIEDVNMVDEDNKN